MSSFRCLLTGDSPLVLTALGLLLQDELEVESVPSILQEFSESVDRFRPNIVVIDRDPDDDGMRLRACAGALRPAPEVLFLASRASGASGVECIDRSSSPEQFVAAVRIAAQKGQMSLARRLRNGLALVDAATGDTARLSIREQQVLRQLSLGKRMKEVAHDLGISPRTVAFHKYRAMQANGLRNNYELLRFCIRFGLLSAVGDFGE